MNFTVADMSREHIAAVAELEKECFSSPWSYEGLAEELSNPLSHFLVAVSEEHGELLGYIGVREICGEAYITNVAVTSAARRCGVGRALLRAACGGAELRNCEFITLEVRASNSPARALYESEGFKPVGVRKNFYTRPQEDGVIYTKYFNVR